MYINMIHVTEESDLKLAGLSVVKFTAAWCQPCKKLETVFQKMENEFPEIKIYSVDIDQCIKLTQKYKILSVPTMIFFNGEIEQQKMVGLSTTEAIRKAFKALMK